MKRRPLGTPENGNIAGLDSGRSEFLFARGNSHGSTESMFL